MIHLKDTLEFPSFGITEVVCVFFRLCQLSFVCTAAEMSSIGLPLREVLCFVLMLAADRRPSPLLLNVNISHTVMNVWWPESRSRLSALTSPVFSLSISPLLFLTTIYSHLCLGQRSVLRWRKKSWPQQLAGTRAPVSSNHTFMWFNKYWK